MGETNGSAPQFSVQEIIDQRRRTERIAQHLQSQLLSCLETLRPLFAPERFLGKKYLGPTGQPTWSDKFYADFLQEYKKLGGKPFDLSPEFNADWLSLVNPRLELYRWEYVHEARSAQESKAIVMTSPVRWVLAYKSDFTLGEMRQALATRLSNHPDQVRQFVISALLMQSVVARMAGLAELLSALRYQVQIETAPEFGRLPLVTISSVLSSFRPADEHILAATALSGVPAFIELIDLEALAQMPDPWKVRLQELLH